MTSEFTISLLTASTLFAFTLLLCRILQTVDFDLASAVGHVNIVIGQIRNIRVNIDEEFKNIFEESEALIKSVDKHECIRIPRIVGRQQNRSNVMVANAEYFRITIAIPFSDYFVEELSEIFASHKETLSSLYCLVPTMCVTTIH